MAADFLVCSVRVSHRDADLSDPPQSFLDQATMAAMKRLIAADEQCRRFLWVECRTKLCQSLLSPIFRRAVSVDNQIGALGRDKHLVGILEPAGGDTVDPDGERVAESRAGLNRRADKICDDGSAGLDDPIAHPAHAARVLDPVLMTEAQIARKIGAHGIGIEHDGVEQRRKRFGQRGLARARADP